MHSVTITAAPRDCPECRGTGRREYQAGAYWADFVVEPCRWCRGTGTAQQAAAATIVPFPIERPRPAA
jgi:DnaJ-class molecular chaperone